MAPERPVSELGLENRVRERRLRAGWSQDELARRAGLSRAGVSAVETGRLVPSTAAALALGAALGCRVEEIFALPGGDAPAWAWEPPEPKGPCRYWRAEVAGRARLYPVEPTALGTPHDGIAPGGDAGLGTDPAATLVLAGCDPAVGLLADAVARHAGGGIRVIALPRSSRAALELLGRGLVHAAGIHLGRPGDDGEGNAAAVREALGEGYALLRVAKWQEGVAFGAGRRFGSVGEVARAGLRWVGREAGSGARQCLDELLGDRPPPRRLRLARDHRGVAEAVRAGWADAGVCVRLAGEEAGLGFLPVREEVYDLCIADAARDDPRLRALVAAVRSPAYRRRLAELPGYAAAGAGELRKAAH
jgi:molybdate-binding protein/DNA-binding XRE family transcriptional regulator